MENKKKIQVGIVIIFLVVLIFVATGIRTTEAVTLEHIGPQGSSYITTQALNNALQGQLIIVIPIEREEVEVTSIEENIEEPETIEIQGKIKDPIEKLVEEPENRWGISLSDDERYLLACITYLEAGNQGLVGQEAVVEVIFNRMIDDYYGGSLYEVLSRNGQFATWPNRNKSKPTEETYQAIDEVLAGNTNIFGPEYLYFSRGGHKKHSGYRQLGDHQFCTK